MDKIIEALLPLMQQRFGSISIETAKISHPEHGTGTLDKKFRPCWLDLDTNHGPISLFFKAPHHAEPQVYTLLAELDIPAPRLWGSIVIQGEEICVLDDCGRANLAQIPGNSINCCQHTPEAIILDLARLHARTWGWSQQRGSQGWRDAQFYLQRLAKIEFQGWEPSPFRDSFEANLPLLLQCKDWLTQKLPWVFQDTWAMTHGDASAVNVAMADAGATLVDWGDARLSTCLWDLPQLVNSEAKFSIWYRELKSQNSNLPSQDELYQKYLGAVLFSALTSCAGRLNAWKMQWEWMHREFYITAAVDEQFQQLLKTAEGLRITP